MKQNKLAALFVFNPGLNPLLHIFTARIFNDSGLRIRLQHIGFQGSTKLVYPSEIFSSRKGLV